MTSSDEGQADRFEPGRAIVPSLGDGATDLHPTAQYPEVTGAVEPSGVGAVSGAGLVPGDPVSAGPSPLPAVAGAAPGDPGFVGVAVPTRGRLRRGLFWLIGAIVVIVVAALGLGAAGLWPDFANPFGEKTTDRSQPALLKSIKDLSRFVAAEGNFEVIIDLQKDRRYIPDALVNDRILFVAAGSVEAYVDFTSIGQGAIVESSDHETVQIKLPGPQLGEPKIDHDRSYVFAEQRGLFNKLGELFSNDANRLRELYLLSEDKIAAAARDSGLADRARENTRKMLEGMLYSLGYTSVTVTFAVA